MSQGWEMYFCLVEDNEASVVLDLGLRSTAPDSSRPELLTVRVSILNPSTAGFPARDELPTLREFEDALVRAVGVCAGVLAGRVTSQGHRDFISYVPSGVGVEAPLRKALASTPYQWDWDLQSDPGWRQYLEFLYPSDSDRQWIEDRRVVDALADAGDQPDRPRPVDHWLFFAGAADRDAFAAAVQAEGFSVVSTDDDEDDPGVQRPFRLRLSRVEVVTLKHIHAVVMDLRTKASACDGEYDGWETSVERNDT